MTTSSRPGASCSSSTLRPRAVGGQWRVVTFARAELEPEFASDPLLGEVGWTWLTDSLDQRGVDYTADAGTVTRVVSDPSGTLRQGSERRNGSACLVVPGRRQRRRPPARLVGPAVHDRRPAAPARGSHPSRGRVADHVGLPIPELHLLTEPVDGIPTSSPRSPSSPTPLARSQPAGVGGPGRRTGFGLPLQPTGLSGAGAPRGRRFLSHRPDCLPGPVTDRRRDRRCRVDPARGHPGPGLSGRGRTAPRQLFDTELAARILGLPRVGLAATVEHYLGVSLAKEHSAVDWSTRPLPSRGCAMPRSMSKSSASCATSWASTWR